MTLQHRAAVALRSSADHIRTLALAASDEGRTVEYRRLCMREAELVRASGLAAVGDNTSALRLVSDAGLVLPGEDDIDTVRARRRCPHSTALADGSTCIGDLNRLGPRQEKP